MAAGDLPPDPVTAMAEGAAQLHELYASYVAAGFRRREALELVKAVMVAAFQAGLNAGGKS
jgi:hypothetical protein